MYRSAVRDREPAPRTKHLRVPPASKVPLPIENGARLRETFSMHPDTVYRRNEGVPSFAWEQERRALRRDGRSQQGELYNIIEYVIIKAARVHNYQHTFSFRQDSKSAVRNQYVFVTELNTMAHCRRPPSRKERKTTGGGAAAGWRRKEEKSRQKDAGRERERARHALHARLDSGEGGEPVGLRRCLVQVQTTIPRASASIRVIRLSKYAGQPESHYDDMRQSESLLIDSSKGGHR